MIISVNEINIFCSLKIEKYNTESLNDAYSFCKKIAKSHYENFPVGSILVPKNIANYIYSIYAFARVADDIADEISKTNPNQSLILLKQYENCLDNCLTENAINNPIFLSLKDTILANNLPIDLFKKLLIAFERDINFMQANNFDDLLDYCNYSANPIGELILRLFKENNEDTIFYSNKICTALQLINFLQDLSADLSRKRNYIPKSLLKNTQINKEIITNYIEFIEEFLNDGKNILKLVKSFRLRNELRLIILGGKIILKKIRMLAKKCLN